MKEISILALHKFKDILDVVGSECPSEYGLYDSQPCDNCECGDCWRIAVDKRLKKELEG